MSSLQSIHEHRLERYAAALTRQFSKATQPAKEDVWWAIFHAARRIGCSVEEAEQYADRWWVDGGF